MCWLWGSQIDYIEKYNEVVLVMTQTPIIVFIRLLNNATWTPAISKVELFVTANSQKLLPNVTKSFAEDVIGVIVVFTQTRVFHLAMN